jgi:hypothetical protein
MAHEKTGEIRAGVTPVPDRAAQDDPRGMSAGGVREEDERIAGGPGVPLDVFDRDLTKQAADAAASRLRRRGS